MLLGSDAEVDECPQRGGLAAAQPVVDRRWPLRLHAGSPAGRAEMHQFGRAQRGHPTHSDLRGGALATGTAARVGGGGIPGVRLLLGKRSFGVGKIILIWSEISGFSAFHCLYFAAPGVPWVSRNNPV